MPGGPPWSQRGTKGGGQTVATNDRPEVLTIKEQQGSDQNQLTTETIEITPPSGAIYELIALRFEVKPDPDWTQGVHSFRVRYGTDIDVVRAGSDYRNRLEFDRSRWMVATEYQEPAHRGATVAAIEGTIATPQKPIELSYRVDNMGGVQENTRNYVAVVKKSTF
jgi:hypothetical protein